MNKLLLPLFASLFFLSSPPVAASCFNPLTDICWSCLFPFHIAGANVSPSHRDFLSHDDLLCHCQGGIIGLPVAYWQPKQICEVTMNPYKLVSFGGLQLADPSLKKRGYLRPGEGGHFEGLYHVHFYNYPALSLLDAAANFVCVGSPTQKSDNRISVVYMSEFDPFWVDEAWNNLLYPEALLFGSPLALAACISDCLASTIQKPTDKLFWCAGCQGSLFPLHGFVSHIRGGVQASSLLVHRTLAKLHYLGELWSYPSKGKKKYCDQVYTKYPPKTSYKIQIALPVKQTTKTCPALGASEFLWGFQKSYPGKGEEFVYVIWNRAHCCVDPSHIAKKTQTGGAG